MWKSAKNDLYDYATNQELVGYSFPRSQHQPRKARVLVEFLLERNFVSLLPLDALGAVKGIPIELLLVCVRSLAHFRENPVTKRG